MHCTRHHSLNSSICHSNYRCTENFACWVQRLRTNITLFRQYNWGNNTDVPTPKMFWRNRGLTAEWSFTDPRTISHYRPTKRVKPAREIITESGMSTSTWRTRRRHPYWSHLHRIRHYRTQQCIDTLKNLTDSQLSQLDWFMLKLKINVKTKTDNWQLQTSNCWDGRPWSSESRKFFNITLDQHEGTFSCDKQGSRIQSNTMNILCGNPHTQNKLDPFYQAFSHKRHSDRQTHNPYDKPNRY